MAQAKKSKRHRSALKAHRQSVTRNLRNRQIKKGVRAAVRAVSDAATAKDTGKLSELMSKASAALDKAARTGAIHWKAAARKKSRLAHRAAQALAAAK
ncbi:MAG: 30S ribosomal protein S20 [Elusimicrobia bacterium]|nr:30S ribosomal protein S20 [Elusimicrobiota bacterium]